MRSLKVTLVLKNVAVQLHMYNMDGHFVMS